MDIEIVVADYSNPKHSQDIVFLLNQYALDPAGGGAGLSQYAQENLVKELAKLPFAFSILAYVEAKPAGLINCFTLFSTFKCKPLVNIHDLFVLASYRKQGISHKMLAEVEKTATKQGACKITLEVLEKNYPARNSYTKFGFVDYELDPKYGRAIFLEKSIS